MKLTLAEYSRIEGVPLTQDQVATLMTVPAQLSLSPSAGRPDRFDITAGSCVGTLRAGSLHIEIRPKVPVGNLMFLLTHATEHQRNIPLPASVSDDTSIHEAAAGWFELLIRRAFQRGVLQGYREEEESLVNLRGRLLFDEQVRRRPLHQLPHECRFDDFTEDTEQNRVLRATLRLLLGLPLRSPDLRRRLAAHDAELERVRHVRYEPKDLPRFHFDRLNEHYRPAIELALLLLSARAPTSHLGSTEVPALVFDMNKVFETFLHRALQRVLQLDERSFPRQCHRRALHLDRDKTVRLEPDLIWWHRGRSVWIGDAKYKRVKHALGPNADVYQAVSYCHGSGLSRATLVYATGLSGRSLVHVDACGVTIELLALNLSLAPDALMQRVTSLATSIRSQAREAVRSTRAGMHRIESSL